MEITIALALSILGSVISVSSFVLSRKDKAVKDTKEQSGNQLLIDYRLNKVEEKLDKIIGILDKYDDVVQKIVDDAMERHIEIYHRKEN